MSTSASEPVPQRIGDAERDQAAELLRDHHTAGRLDQVEFDERLSRALTAKTADELTPLFGDLPGPRPGDALARFVAPPWDSTSAGSASRQPPVTPPPDRAAAAKHRSPARAGRALTVVAAALWPIVIMICFVIGWDYWWLIFLPIAVSSMAGSLSGKDTKHRGELEQ